MRTKERETQDRLGYLRWRARTTWPIKRLYKILNPNWYKEAVGRGWETMGRQQFDYLMEKGLEPDHHFLDVGCGSLRAGLLFVRYLAPNRYSGIDIDGDLLGAARKRLKRGGLEGKKALLARTDNFDFPSLSRTFDYALANSVFTHVPLNAVLQCLVNMERVLAPRGRFYATFFENTSERNLEPLRHVYQGTEFHTYLDRDPYHYDFGLFETLARKAGLRVEYLGEWVKGGTQAMMAFARA